MAESSAPANEDLIDPDHILYLLDPEDHNYYFYVGNENLGPVEKIGVVRKMLAAHSVVFRLQIQYGRRKTEKPEHITDIFPHTFKNLLRFVYGHDTISTMKFDDADNLLYAANKYMMTKLKNKLATRLVQLVDYNNICILLNNPACYEALELKSEMTWILQSQTDRLLASKEFLNCCPEAFVRILEEETLNVREVDIWRAAIKWAKSKVWPCRKTAGRLRKQLEAPLKHIRVCAIPLTDFCDHVATDNILSKREVLAVCRAQASKQKPQSLPGLCTIMEPRNPWIVTSRELQGILQYESENAGPTKEGCLIVKTREFAIDITVLSIARHACSFGDLRMTLTIEKNSGETSTIVVASTSNSQGGWIFLPISEGGHNGVLQPNSVYKISFSSNLKFNHFKWSRPSKSLLDFTLEFPIMQESNSSQQEPTLGQQAITSAQIGSTSSRQQEPTSRQQATSTQHRTTPQQDTTSLQQGTSTQQESTSTQPAYLCPIGYIFYKKINITPIPQSSESAPVR